MSIDRIQLPTGEALTVLRDGATTAGAAFEIEAEVPPGLSGARINVEHDYDYVQHGLPDALQRLMWRLLAGRMNR